MAGSLANVSARTMIILAEIPLTVAFVLDIVIDSIPGCFIVNVGPSTVWYFIPLLVHQTRKYFFLFLLSLGLSSNRAAASYNYVDRDQRRPAL